MADSKLVPRSAYPSAHTTPSTGSRRGEVCHGRLIADSTRVQQSFDIYLTAVRTMLEAIISFLPTEGQGAIGALDWTPRERRQLAEEVGRLASLRGLTYCVVNELLFQ